MPFFFFFFYKALNKSQRNMQQLLQYRCCFCFSADCKSLTDPDYGEVVIGSNPYSHREVAVFECNENYTLVGNKEIYCYDGLWGKDPPVCMGNSPSNITNAHTCALPHAHSRIHVLTKLKRMGKS